METLNNFKMKNLKKTLLVLGCVCLSFTLFSFKSTNQSLNQSGDSTVVYESKVNSDDNLAAIPTTKLAKKVYQNDCRLVVYAVIDWATSIFGSNSGLEANIAKEKQYKLSQL
jgi:hypothetical protein